MELFPGQFILMARTMGLDARSAAIEQRIGSSRPYVIVKNITTLTSIFNVEIANSKRS
jgi:hypothetical protein